MANPPADFVDIPFTPDANAKSDAAVEQLRGTWTDWEPDDADPEVVLIEAIAPMAAEVEAMAAQMPAEAIISLGQNLYGIPYDPGTPAQTTVTLMFVDGAGGYEVDAQSQVQIDGYAFAINDDYTSAAGETSHSVAVTCTVNAAAASGLVGTVCVPLNLPAYVTSSVCDAPTSDGTDPMDNPTYVNLVIAKIRLRADSLITAGDFALEATLQPGVGFAWAQGNTARQVTVVLADPNALPLPSSVKDAINTIFSSPSVRSVNVTYTLLDPSYTVVNVTWRVTAAAGQDVTALTTQINNLLTSQLSPITAVKNTDLYIHVNKLISLIGGLQGVDFVESIVLSSPTGGTTVESNGDLLMAGGLASLPTPGTFAATVDVATS